MTTVFTAYVGLESQNEELSKHSNKATLIGLLNASDLSYSIVYADGMYLGTEEDSAIITCIAEEEAGGYTKHKLIKALNSYKLLAQQQEVWLTERQEYLEVL